MASRLEDREFRKQIEQIESLIQEAERFPDLKAREQTRAIVQRLMDLHGAGLNRMLEMTAATGQPGLDLIDTLADDELVGSLFLLYGLHPLDLETRVRQALDKVRPYLRTHGVDIELASTTDAKVQVRLQGDCQGCGSSSSAIKQAIEEAIYEKAPEVAAIIVESSDGEIAGERARFALPILGK